MCCYVRAVRVISWCAPPTAQPYYTPLVDLKYYSCSKTVLTRATHAPPRRAPFLPPCTAPPPSKGPFLSNKSVGHSGQLKLLVRHAADAAAAVAAAGVLGEAAAAVEVTAAPVNLGMDSAHGDGQRLPSGMKQWGDSSFDIDMSQLQCGASVGQGNFGAVMKGTYDGGKGCAVKIQPAPIEDDAAEIMANLVSELSVLRAVSEEHDRADAAGEDDAPCRYLVRFFGAGLIGLDVYFVMELADRGDLRGVVASTAPGPPPAMAQLLQWLRQASLGLQELHNMEIIHRDFKTENVLIRADNTACVCDFGFAIYDESAFLYTTCAGTPEFIAPELELGTGEYGTALDVFSLGVTFAEAVTGKCPGENGFLERGPRDCFCIDGAEVRVVYTTFSVFRLRNIY